MIVSLFTRLVREKFDCTLCIHVHVCKHMYAHTHSHTHTHTHTHTPHTHTYTHTIHSHRHVHTHTKQMHPIHKLTTHMFTHTNTCVCARAHVCVCVCTCSSVFFFSFCLSPARALGMSSCCSFLPNSVPSFLLCLEASNRQTFTVSVNLKRSNVFYVSVLLALLWQMNGWRLEYCL